METVLFYLFGLFSVISALMVILHRNPVYNALFLVQTFFCLAGLYVLLNAHFIAAVQVLVYAGAIMVLFLFVIMLLNLQRLQKEFRVLFRLKVTSAFLVCLLLIEIVYLVFVKEPSQSTGLFTPDVVAQQGNTELIGNLLFTEYLFPFEVASILLLVAMIGVVVLAKSAKKQQEVVQEK